jgi:hypothetical protein
MRIRIQVMIEGENSHEETIEEVGCLERGALRPEELGNASMLTSWSW